MNKHCYRIIFSKTLNRLVVVSELAKTAGKAVAEGAGKAMSAVRSLSKLSDFGLHIAAVTCFIGLGFLYVPQTFANPLEIHADKSAPSAQQPTVLRAANGTPQVNIQTPSAGGVSRNVYSQFDVSEKGAILNNSRKAAGSQLAGWVQANPNLIRGEAKVILNEVNAKEPSQLKGYVEVAGQKADVIIANPNGLHCDGCGVINASRATLTTGEVELENGKVKGFHVRSGEVKVKGKGMDTSRADYTDIIAGNVKAEAGIWAKELKVTVGKNRVDRTNDKVVYVGDGKHGVTESRQVAAVDVSELGGMYANRIHMVVTEQGVGVNNAGQIGASAGNVYIDSHGKITNSGYLGSQQDIRLTSKDTVTNKGTLYTQQGDVKLNGTTVSQQGSVIAKGAPQNKGQVQIKAKQAVRQTGDTLAENHIEFQAQNVTVADNATVVAGMDFTQNELAAKKDGGKNTTLKAEKTAKVNGRVLSSDRTEIEAKQVSIDNSLLQSNHLSVTATDNSNISAVNSRIYTENRAVFTTPATLITQNAQLNAKSVSVNANRADNTQGVWINRDNQDLVLDFKGGLANQNGIISTGGRLLFNGDKIDNRAGLLDAESYRISTTAFDNAKGKLIQRGENSFALDVKGTLLNDKGVIGYQRQAATTLNTGTASVANGISAAKATATTT